MKANLGIVVLMAALAVLLYQGVEALKVLAFVVVFVAIKFAAAYANILVDRLFEDGH